MQSCINFKKYTFMFYYDTTFCYFEYIQLEIYFEYWNKNSLIRSIWNITVILSFPHRSRARSVPFSTVPVPFLTVPVPVPDRSRSRPFPFPFMTVPVPVPNRSRSLPFPFLTVPVPDRSHSWPFLFPFLTVPVHVLFLTVPVPVLDRLIN